jgi:hypothetical protein
MADEVTLKTIRDVFALPEPSWEAVTADAAMFDYIRQRAEEPAFVDPANTRSEMYAALQQGHASVVVRECTCSLGQNASWGARVVYVSESPYPAVAAAEVPWSTWGRIFQLFGPPRGGGSSDSYSKSIGKPRSGAPRWEVIVFASSRKREFPPEGTLLAPEHINGGSAYRCEPSSILIVRREEMTRVLIHELLHAGCTDNPNLTVPQIEAQTEAWAEWFLTAIMARGLQPRFCELWPRQVAYAEKQAAMCLERKNIQNTQDYGCRYITDRIQAWKDLGLYPTCPKPTSVKVNTLRFSGEFIDPAIVYAKPDKRKPTSK